MDDSSKSSNENHSWKNTNKIKYYFCAKVMGVNKTWISQISCRVLETEALLTIHNVQSQEISNKVGKISSSYMLLH